MTTPRSHAPARPLWQGAWQSADAILRGALPGADSLGSGSGRPGRAAWGTPVAAVALLGALYGAVMGAYGLSSGASGGQALWPLLFGALKVPVLLLLTGALSLPAFLVLYTLCGLRDDFLLVLRSLLAAQVGLSAILASLAPFTVLCYVSMPASSASYAAAVLWNFAMFGLATLLSQGILRRHLRPLWQRDPRHLALLRAWVVIYGFVGVQLAYVLRPFIGDPAHAAAFFRADAFSNAYIALWNLLLRSLLVS